MEYSLTTEQLRAEIIRGIDAILEGPWLLRRNITAEQLRLLRAQRAFWMAADTDLLTSLLAYYDREPLRENTP